MPVMPVALISILSSSFIIVLAALISGTPLSIFADGSDFETACEIDVAVSFASTFNFCIAVAAFAIEFTLDFLNVCTASPSVAMSFEKPLMFALPITVLRE